MFVLQVKIKLSLGMQWRHTGGKNV